MILNVMAYLQESEVNGPGKRFVVWLQKCTHCCRGCFNPESWSDEEKILIDHHELKQIILDSKPEGLTISGGEPFAQAEGLFYLLNSLHSNYDIPKGTIVFTGYTLEELRDIPYALKCMLYIDLLIDGKYVEALKTHDGLRGSSNQRFIFNPLRSKGKAKINDLDIIFDQNIEIHTNENGTLEITGFPDMDNKTRRYLKKIGLKIVN